MSSNRRRQSPDAFRPDAKCCLRPLHRSPGEPRVLRVLLKRGNTHRTSGKLGAEEVLRFGLGGALALADRYTEQGLDNLILTAIAASGFQAPGTDRFLVSVRKAMTTIFAAGYNPDLLILTPAAAEALDTDQSLGTEKFWTFGAGNFAPCTLFGMSVRVSKTIPASAVVDSSAFGRLYASPVSLASFEADGGTTNRTNVRMEGHAAFGVERQNAAIRIAAA